MKPNPHLKAAFMEIVDNQIRDNEPPETRLALDRLVAKGIPKPDAKLYIGQAIAVEIWDTITNNKAFDDVRYRRNLDRLPEEPQV